MRIWRVMRGVGDGLMGGWIDCIFCDGVLKVVS